MVLLGGYEGVCRGGGAVRVNSGLNRVLAVLVVLRVLVVRVLGLTTVRLTLTLAGVGLSAGRVRLRLAVSVFFGQGGKWRNRRDGAG